MINRWAIVSVVLLGLIHGQTKAGQDEPPAINPFGARKNTREDAYPGCAEMSDGSIYPGKLYLTRDARLKVYDTEIQRQREIPLRVVQRIDCTIEREWMEKEWRFRENANDAKVFTGRSYPARLLAFTVTLKDGRKISGPLSGVIYVDPYQGTKTQKLLMQKRQKGTVGSELSSLVYLKTVELGEEALRRGQLRADQRSQREASRRKKGSQP